MVIDYSLLVIEDFLNFELEGPLFTLGPNGRSGRKQEYRHPFGCLYSFFGEKNRGIKADFSLNVCYIKHFCLLLHLISYNYGKEHIWKDDAKGIEPEPENHG